MAESEILKLVSRWMDAAERELGDAAEVFAATAAHAPKSAAECTYAQVDAKRRLQRAAVDYAAAAEAYEQIIHMPVKKQQALSKVESE